MYNTQYKEANDVLNYWFAGGDPSKRPKWCGSGEAEVKDIRDKFGPLVEKARNDELKHWENDPAATLALIILQDQFLRSVYKGTPLAFSRDKYCEELARKFLKRETHDHLKINPDGRAFIYLPLMHAENKESQKLCVQMFDQLMKDVQGCTDEASGRGWPRFDIGAALHKEVVDRFGRFPQRNKALGRQNSPEEDEWLSNLPDRYKW